MVALGRLIRRASRLKKKTARAHRAAMAERVFVRSRSHVDRAATRHVRR
ncbi:hypothetical protein K788_00012105 [Paraburkholderia caribensis MBA4]|uniref:Uncharacterized protein n=1 Tax=Paraburkholderia caribensis MBA4 TaxID=1323664 RepID=A0A0P0R8W4_9BURK|nr:hypothetical protein K788_00012105 [Paraburkholderia caribensis MBA4]